MEEEGEGEGGREECCVCVCMHAWAPKLVGAECCCMISQLATAHAIACMQGITGMCAAGDMQLN